MIKDPFEKEMPGENHHLEEKRFTVTKQKKEKLLQEIRHFLENYPEVKFAYVHGSFTEDLPFQDIDIAVYYDDNIPQRKQLDMSLELSAALTHKLRLPVDIQALNRSAPGFQYYATRGLVASSQNDEERYEFVEKAWITYMDYEPILKETLRDLLLLEDGS